MLVPAFRLPCLKDQGWDLRAVTRMIFVMNVGKDSNSSVYVGNVERPGSHWTLVVVDFATGHVFFTTPWLPKELFQILQ